MTDRRTYVLISEMVREAALRVIANLPVDGSMELVIQHKTKQRTDSQNRLMWGARLREISEQAWVGGKQYGAEVWHEYLKQKFLPEGNEEDFARLVRSPETYRKWDELPDGERVLVGSTTQLTTLGMSRYMTECEAYATQELGVMFSADRRYA